MDAKRMRRAAGPVGAALLALTLAASAQAQDEPVTDSVSGDLVELHEDSFVVRTDDGRTLTFEIAADSAQEQRETAEDSTEVRERVAHSSYMRREDLVMALRQIAASDESDAVHLHYVTEGVPERRVAV